MKASIHISTNMVEVLSYTKMGSNVSIKDYFTYALPEECVINGVILDGNPVIEGLRSLQNANPHLFKDSSLVLDGSFVYTKRINVPGKLNKWMYYQVIRDEFAEIVTDPENLICDYLPLGLNEDGSKQILACAVENAHINTYLTILKEAGIAPKKVHLGIQAILRYINTQPELKKQPFVLNIVDGEILLSMIFQNGISVFQSRSRLYGDDRATLVQNSLDGLSGIIQFNKSQNFDDIRQCYYLGLSDSDMDFIRMSNAYPDINFFNIELFRNVKGGGGLPPNAHIVYLNTLLSDSEPDLLNGMKILEKLNKRNKPKKIWIPILIGLGVALIGVIALLWILTSGVEREIRDLNNYLDSPQVHSEKEEIARLTADTAALTASYDEAKQQIDDDNAKPEITSNIINTIVQTGGNTITIDSFAFRDTDGLIQVNAVAATEFDASDYIERLRSNSTIDYVEYLGYALESAGAFRFTFQVKAH